MSDDGGADGVDDVADVVIRDPRAGGKADADAEQRLAHTVGVGGGAAVDRLTVHRFPQRARLDAGCVEDHAQGFDIVVWLAVGRGRLYGVCDACSSAYRSADDLTVGVLLPTDFQVGGERGGAQPVVGIVIGRRSFVERDAGNVFQQLAVERLDVAVVGDIKFFMFRLATLYS